MTSQTILIVEDDEKIRTLLRNILEIEGFSVRETGNHAGAMKILASTNIDLVTLDIHLGPDNGLAIAREIRHGSAVPIIMVTGQNDVIDRVVGLEIGADDYITKPFHIREVVARIRSVLRRAGGEAARGMPAADPQLDRVEAGNSLMFRFDGVTAVPDELSLTDREGNECAITSGDFRLLSVFLERPKRVLSRDQLMDLIGGQSWSPLDRTIDNQVARLRKKIERDPSDPKLIKTVRGIGYTMACDVESGHLSDQPPKSA